MKTTVLFGLTALLLSFSVCAQEMETNEDERKVNAYVLPELLRTNSGKLVRNVRDWERVRRPEILAAFEDYIFGKTPVRKLPPRIAVTSVDQKALNGKAIRKQITVFFSQKDKPKIDILLYLPAGTRKPFPVFLALNFEGNHSVCADSGITISQRWMRYDKVRGIENHYATAASRGSRAERWPVEEILQRGYGLATVYQGDVELDRPERSPDDIHAMFRKPGPGDWGGIAAWSWGLSRVMDYLVTDTQVDAKKVAVLGHSRLGKAALWAGALDKRFAMVISNNSGEGGASLYRRNFGETIADLTRAVPYWFCENFSEFSGHENDLPVDAHELIALMAPRPVYVASAVEDTWADPRGEFLSLYHASPAYHLYGLRGLESNRQPDVGQNAGAGVLGYHLRKGDHELTRIDWQYFLNFADRYFKKKM
ncbi:Carbohydrate esterase [Dyadobacter sp. CECT 9275]|uniref:Carbohydrate esterase n=1 Tax=Dyadobacter helix TaxID=2822344 RepID=A0A916J9C0_9BACT|nr:acetylxylan esterase [Dyadobacter sp. CECT 9275]CAG4992438.1 Carbohydrate esterase [Dyadobacter sp. CECT 9275]